MQPRHDNPSAPTPAGHGGVLGKLLAAVRPEFRADVYLPDPDDPVFGTGRCAADDCTGSAFERGLCAAHHARWLDHGRLRLADFLAAPGGPVLGRTQPQACRVAGCRFGASGGMCLRHSALWRRAGRPDPVAFAAGLPAVEPGDHPECSMPFCGLWTTSDQHPFCKTHTTRWRQLGCPDLEVFIADRGLRGRLRIDLRGLPPQLKLELQYVLQCRHDEQTLTVRPPIVTQAVRHLADAGVASLLDLHRPVRASRRPPKLWRSSTTPPTSSRCCATAPDGTPSTTATSGGCTSCLA